MKLVDIKIVQFKKGDYVRTPDGVGIVVNSEFTFNSAGGLWWYDVEVQHKFSNSSNTNNDVSKMDGIDCVSIITKEEYDEETW